MYGALRFVRLFPTFLQKKKKKANGIMDDDVIIKPALGKEGIG